MLHKCLCTVPAVQELDWDVQTWKLMSKYHWQRCDGERQWEHSNSLMLSAYFSVGFDPVWNKSVPLITVLMLAAAPGWFTYLTALG